MYLNEIFTNILMSLSLILGVNTLPETQDKYWEIQSSWIKNENYYESSFISKNIAGFCLKNPDFKIYFPMIIQGTTEISYSDGTLIKSFGDKTFNKAGLFYLSPVLNCSDIKIESPIIWRSYSFAKYFARIQSFPEVSKEDKLNNIFSVTFDIIATGTLLLLSIFSLILFRRKVSNQLAFSVFFSNLFLSFYFLGTVTEFFNLNISMITAHKIADIGLWTGILFMFNSFRLEGLVPKILFNIYLILCSFSITLISLTSYGDSIQFGTSIPFGVVLTICGVALYKIITSIGKRNFYQLLSIFFFYICSIHDVFVVLGLKNDYPVFALGIMLAMLFLTLSVNEKIMNIYNEYNNLNTNLQKEVEKKTTELNLKKEKLELVIEELKETQESLIKQEKMASLGALSGGIAHEINNPLQIISLNTECLRDHVESNKLDRNKILENISNIERTSTRIQNIIQGLRFFNHNIEESFEVCDLSQILQISVGFCNEKLRGNNINVLINKDMNDQFFFNGNSVQIGQVILNLITNSIDSIKNKEIKNIIINIKEEDEFIFLSVKDSGDGVPDSIKLKIFDPFFTTKEIGAGTGLGLSISKGIIHKHGGILDLDSKDSSVFYFRLPKLTLS